MHSPVNILYMIDSLAPGGTERQLIGLIQHLDQGRFRPHLCILKTANELYAELDIPKLSLEFTSFSKSTTMKSVYALDRFIRANRIHIIETFFQDPFLLAAMVRPFHRLKLIGSFRDLGFWRTPSETRKMRTAYPFFSGFTANSQAVKEHIVKVDGLDPQKIEVIYNGFDFDAVPGNPPPKPACSPPVVGIVANLNRPVKRVQDFIHAAALVHQQDSQVRFKVVGDGHLRADLERLASSVGLGDSIHFLGIINPPLDTITTFDVGVITSETEGFCNALIEYMACGVPVVATAVGGNKELVDEGINGFLAPVARVDLLSNRILSLLSDKEQRTRMGKENREKIRHNFNWPKVMEKRACQYEGRLAS